MIHSLVSHQLEPTKTPPGESVIPIFCSPAPQGVGGKICDRAVPYDDIVFTPGEILLRRVPEMVLDVFAELFLAAK